MAEGTVGVLEIHRRFMQFGNVFLDEIGTLDYVSIRVMEPEKHVVLWVCDYRIRRNPGLVELVKKTLQPLMGVVSHGILKWIPFHFLL